MNVSVQQKRMQRIVAAYRKAAQTWPATKHDIAKWAVGQGLCEAEIGSDVVGVLADQLARAMAEEYLTDPQGRQVRTKHAVKAYRNRKQLALWDDIRTADPAHMAAAFQQRRFQIVGECKQLKTDVNSYNENWNPGEPIQLPLDFTDDVAEAEAVESLDRGPSLTELALPVSRARIIDPKPV